MNTKLSPIDCEDDVVRDARRYRRLQILGCAPFESRNLTAGTVLRFSNLDAFIDSDLEREPRRGEVRPLPSGASS